MKTFYVIEIDTCLNKGFAKRAYWSGTGSVYTTLPECAWKRRDAIKAAEALKFKYLKAYNPIVKEICK